MPAITMVEENEATDEVKEIYGDIKSTLGIDFVPNMYKLMAPNPPYLQANWHKVKAVMVEPGELDRLTKEIIAVAVSATNSCQLTARPHFCGAEAGPERQGSARADGGRRPLQRLQQTPRRATRRAGQEALVGLRIRRMNAVRIHHSQTQCGLNDASRSLRRSFARNSHGAVHTEEGVAMSGETILIAGGYGLVGRRIAADLPHSQPGQGGCAVSAGAW